MEVDQYSLDLFYCYCVGCGMMDRSIIRGLSSTVKDGDDMITQELKQQILSLSSDEQHEIVRLIQEQTNSSTATWLAKSFIPTHAY